MKFNTCFVWKKIKCINIFDGKNEVIKPDKIEEIKGAVSLGNYSCGRETDIKNKGLSLHVIVSNYFLNISAMN